MRQAARAYFETQVTTTSQGKLLIMLYDGAIKFLNRAKLLIEAKDYSGKGKLISSAIDIINELASSLNAEKGGELATNLSQLYFYCNKRLFMANSRMDTAPIDEVITILDGIRSAYAQIIDTPEAVAAMAQAPSPTNKAPRAPLGVQTTPVGAPMPTARVQAAYATQSAAVHAAPAPAVAPTQITAPAPTAAPAPAVPPAAVARAAAPSPAPPPLPEPAVAAPIGPALPDLPDLDVGGAPAPLSQAKRAAQSSLYRKFAS